MKKIMALILAALLLAALLVGCGSSGGASAGGSGNSGSSASSGGSGDKAPASAKDTIVIGCETEPASIGPTGSTGEQTVRVRRLLCEGMFDVNQAGEFIPKLATSWEWTDDQTLVFHLREGVKFSDGIDFTADDVVFTVENQMATGGSLLSQYVDEVKALDTYTVSVHFNQPNSLCFDKFSTQWLPVIHKETFEADPNEMNYDIIGTGPYVLKEWVTGESMTLERNENYWGEPAKIKNVVFRFISEGSARTVEMETGGIDINCFLDASDREYFQGDEYVVTLNPGVFLRELFFNLSRETPIKDVRVRKAIAYAFDVEGMCETYLDGTSEALTSNISPTYAAIYEPGKEILYSYNLDKAKELMAEAGYPDGGFKLSLLCSATNQADTDQAQILQAALKPLGIDVELVMRDSMTWYTTVLEKQEWDMCWFSLGDESPVFAWMHFLGDTDNFGMPDYTFYRNDKFTEALTEATKTNDQARQKELFAFMNDCVTEDLPMYSLYDPSIICVYNSKLQGIEYRSGRFNVEEMYFVE